MGDNNAKTTKSLKYQVYPAIGKSGCIPYPLCQKQEKKSPKLDISKRSESGVPCSLYVFSKL